MQYPMFERRFTEIDSADSFFDSLKADYREFEDWFSKKADAKAYVLINETGGIEAFLHTKREDGPVTDVTPEMPAATRLKVGTFKANAHGTRLSERLLKKAFDQAVRLQTGEVYVTVFPRHTAIVQLFQRYGFERVGTKATQNGVEDVLARRLQRHTGDVIQDFPNIPVRGNGKFLLAIYPEYHTRLFPDSILQTESIENLDDVSHTNSIHKIYVCWMDLWPLKRGDALVIYRTTDKKGPAWHRSVATSICVVEEVRGHSRFANEDDYVEYCLPYSVFGEAELRHWWRGHPRLQVIRMTYNAALLRRINRRVLVEDVGLNEDARWGFLPLTDSQFAHILKLGQVNAGLIVN
jgi:L-amino acid N-acyltransferase YncA